MNLFWPSLPQMCIWACVAFGEGVLLALTGLWSSDVPQRRRRMPMSTATVLQVSAVIVGDEGTWRWRFFVCLICVLVFLPVSLGFFALLTLTLLMVLGMVAAVVGASCLFYRQVARRALRRWERDSDGTLSWCLGLRIMWQRMRRKHTLRYGQVGNKEARDR